MAQFCQEMLSVKIGSPSFLVKRGSLGRMRIILGLVICIGFLSRQMALGLVLGYDWQRCQQRLQPRRGAQRRLLPPCLSRCPTHGSSTLLLPPTSLKPPPMPLLRSRVVPSGFYFILPAKPQILLTQSTSNLGHVRGLQAIPKLCHLATRPCLEKPLDLFCPSIISHQAYLPTLHIELPPNLA